jgi:hypothetical protein
MKTQYPIEVDPIALKEDLQSRIKRYLLTALPISRRFPKLRENALEKLRAIEDQQPAGKFWGCASIIFTNEVSELFNCFSLVGIRKRTNGPKGKG